MSYAQIGKTSVATDLKDFVDREVLPGTGVAPEKFWTGLAALVADFSPRIRDQLRLRDELQARIDAYHLVHRGKPFDMAGYEAFLREIGYIVPEPADFSIRTENTLEVARVSGPQLVVPASNARFVLNAANARWGSLYDALYGSDVIPDDRRRRARRALQQGARRRASSNMRRRCSMISCRSPKAATRTSISYKVANGELVVELDNGLQTHLRHPGRFSGYRATGRSSFVVLLRQHGLHIELVIDPMTVVGAESKSGLSDVILEAALSTIVDLEDSVAAVDAPDKIGVYGNWLGLMKGDLTATLEKNGLLVERRLALDRTYIDRDGAPKKLHGRSLLLVRNVGHHVMTDIVLDAEGRAVPETIVDAAITALIALHDLNGPGPVHNSRSRFDLHRQAEDAWPGRGRARQSTCSPASRTCSGCPGTR